MNDKKTSDTVEENVKTLEALAVRCEERAKLFDSVAAGWGPKDREQAYGDAGIAAGFRGAAEFAREAIAELEKSCKESSPNSDNISSSL